MRVLAVALSLLAGGASAGAECDLGADARRVTRALELLEPHVPPRFFEEAYGYAVLPSVKRVGFGLGGAWGRGWVFARGQPVGRVRLWQLSSGVQTGARTMGLIILFRDEQDMETFRLNRLQFMGQAGFALFGFGRTQTPAYDSGVAVFAHDRFGLMFEASIAGGKVAWRPCGRTPR